MAHMQLMRFAVDGDGVLRHIDDPEVANGAACGCLCPACEAKLIARHGNQNVHHFAHAPGADCRTGAETALHLAAKAVLQRQRRILLPPLIAVGRGKDIRGHEFVVEKKIAERIVDLATVELEVNLGFAKPDVIAAVAGKTLHIEIAVWHFAEEQKINDLRQRGIASLEVDLSNCRDDWTWESVAHELLGRFDNKKWLSNPRYRELRLHADEEATRLAADSDKRRERKRASIPGFLDALRFMERLQSADEVASERKRLRDAGPQEDHWAKVSSELSLEWATLPDYLDVEIPYDVTIPVDRRVWQSGIFEEFIVGRLRNRQRSVFRNIDPAIWCRKTFGFYDEVTTLHRHDYLLAASELALPRPNDVKVVMQYLDYLAQRSFIARRGDRYWIIDNKLLRDRYLHSINKSVSAA